MGRYAKVFPAWGYASSIQALGAEDSRSCTSCARAIEDVSQRKDRLDTQESCQRLVEPRQLEFLFCWLGARSRRPQRSWFEVAEPDDSGLPKSDRGSKVMTADENARIYDVQFGDCLSDPVGL